MTVEVIYEAWSRFGDDSRQLVRTMSGTDVPLVIATSRAAAGPDGGDMFEGCSFRTVTYTDGVREVAEYLPLPLSAFD